MIIKNHLDSNGRPTNYAEVNSDNGQLISLLPKCMCVKLGENSTIIIGTFDSLYNKGNPYEIAESYNLILKDDSSPMGVTQEQCLKNLALIFTGPPSA